MSHILCVLKNYAYYENGSFKNIISFLFTNYQTIYKYNI